MVSLRPPFIVSISALAILLCPVRFSVGFSTGDAQLLPGWNTRTALVTGVLGFLLKLRIDLLVLTEDSLVIFVMRIVTVILFVDFFEDCFFKPIAGLSLHHIATCTKFAAVFSDLNRPNTAGSRHNRSSVRS